MALNLLVVEDNNVMRRMIVKSLRLSGLPLGEIWEAANGQEGLTLAGEKWVDVILADINMPVMNGDVMIDRLREDPVTAEVPIIVVSTESSPKRLEKLRRQVSDVVPKPFTPEAIRQAILKITGEVA